MILTIIASVILLLIALVFLASCFLYFIEHPAVRTQFMKYCTIALISGIGLLIIALAIDNLLFVNLPPVTDYFK